MFRLDVDVRPVKALSDDGLPFVFTSAGTQRGPIRKQRRRHVTSEGPGMSEGDTGGRGPACRRAFEKDNNK